MNPQNFEQVSSNFSGRLTRGSLALLLDVVGACCWSDAGGDTFAACTWPIALCICVSKS